MIKKIKTKPSFEEEQQLWAKGFKHIAGVDEVGRGCFAGPVVAAAVILNEAFKNPDVNDSKKLTAKKRTELAKIIKEEAVAYSIAEISVEVINSIGVGKATQQAFVDAINTLTIKPDFIIIDAFYIQGLSRHNQKPIKHGDGTCISIAAASIIAKVYRDELMHSLHQQYHMYDFATNKGYGTKKHQQAIKQFGLSDLHRKSFDLSKFIL